MVLDASGAQRLSVFLTANSVLHCLCFPFTQFSGHLIEVDCKAATPFHTLEEKGYTTIGFD